MEGLGTQWCAFLSISSLSADQWLRNHSRLHQQNLCFLRCFDTFCQSADIFPEYVKSYNGAAKFQHTLGAVYKSNEISSHFWSEYSSAKIFTLCYKGLS